MPGAVTADGRGRTLGDGTVMPLLGLGVWQVPDGRECVHAVRRALELGYRHIDTAQAYGNEASVGRALRESGLAREEVFLTMERARERSYTRSIGVSNFGAAELDRLGGVAGSAPVVARTWATRPSRRSPSATTAPPRRCCCAGACSAACRR
jgi:diketogulonate reductase-like aldo/keto reductase